MAQSTEDYLDSLLRQAMGIPDPEPEPKPEPDTSTLQREDVLAMADGLTGSNSAILGNAYDHNASFTNEGEINTSVPEPAAEVDQTPQAAEMIADADAPVATPMDVPESETILPDLESILPEVDLTRPESSEFDINEPTATETPIIEQEEIPVPDITNIIPDAPVIDHDESNLDIVPEPVIEITETDPDMIHIPSVEEPPVLEDMPIPEEEPAVEETPVLEEMPVLEDMPILEEEPADEETPVLEDMPFLEDMPILEEEDDMCAVYCPDDLCSGSRNRIFYDDYESALNAWNLYNREIAEAFGDPDWGGNCWDTELSYKEDPVNHPSHYTGGDVECIDAIKASMTFEEYRGYLKGNVLKYLWRYEDKGKPDEDLQKAGWYLARLVEAVKKNG